MLMGPHELPDPIGPVGEVKAGRRAKGQQHHPGADRVMLGMMAVDKAVG
jgi:hypothetical protein